MANNHFHEIGSNHLSLKKSEKMVSVSLASLEKWSSNLNSDVSRWRDKRSTIKARKHFCNSCKKAFKSKHALWGHMRIHSEDNKNPNADIKEQDNEFWRKTTCFVCSKIFQSTNALAGHMNSHPNRGWKGICPPPWVKKPKIIEATHDQDASFGEANQSATPRIFYFDLNKLPPIEE